MALIVTQKLGISLITQSEFCTIISAEGMRLCIRISRCLRFPSVTS